METPVVKCFDLFNLYNSRLITRFNLNWTKAFTILPPTILIDGLGPPVPQFGSFWATTLPEKSKIPIERIANISTLKLEGFLLDNFPNTFITKEV